MPSRPSRAETSVDLIVTGYNTLQNGKLTPFGGKMPSPADIGVDTKRGRVAIPLLLENRVEFRALPATTP